MQKQENKLIYDTPAAGWTQALPLGNGRIGAMVYGDPVSELICLNEDTLWTGFPEDTEVYGAADRLPEARRLVAEGKYLEAQEMIETQMLGREGAAYLPLGNLRLRWAEQGEIGNYRRELDLSSGICRVSYCAEDTRYLREYFVSAVHDALVIRLSCSGAGKLDFEILLESALKHVCFSDGGRILLDGECHSDNEYHYFEEAEKRGVSFRAAVRAEASGGSAVCENGVIRVRGAESVLVYLTVKTSYNGYEKLPFLEGREYRNACLHQLDSLPGSAEYERMKASHAADFSAYFNRVSLTLGNGEKSEACSGARLRAFQLDKSDQGLYALLFHYGRYLLISSSREGTQPANLQGIWNAELVAPWKSNYTLNINLQMNYWPALVCNMPELHEPLIRLTGELEKPGTVTAKTEYGARGFAVHHNTDLWRKTTPVCGKANHAYWNMSAVWLCLHLFEHYLFTGDAEFLRDRALPLMKNAALFCVDFLTENRDGYLTPSPATSPENFFLVDGRLCAVSESATLTASMMRCLFQSVIRAAEILGCRDPFADELKSILPRLEPYRIGSRGQLLEWEKEFPESEPHHRHLSLLFGIFPGSDLLEMRREDLLAAGRQTLNLRGDEGSGWGFSWKAALWARLGEGDRALEMIDHQLRVVTSNEIDYIGGGGTYLNFFDAHPPFQIDGNFGVTAAICEMLLQSHDAVHLLPALPRKWADGEVKGLMARGNISVGMKWENGMLQSAELCSPFSREVTVKYRDHLVQAVLEAGVPLNLCFPD